MYSSPVRRFTSVLLHLLARLACIRRAASVRSEPGSNSQKGLYSNWTRGPPLQYTLPLLITRSIQLSKNCVAFSTRAVYSTTRVLFCQGTIYRIEDFLDRVPAESVTIWNRATATRQDQKTCLKISMHMPGVKPLNTSVITGDNDLSGISRSGRSCMTGSH